MWNFQTVQNYKQQELVRKIDSNKSNLIAKLGQEISEPFIIAQIKELQSIIADFQEVLKAFREEMKPKTRKDKRRSKKLMTVIDNFIKELSQTQSKLSYLNDFF